MVATSFRNKVVVTFVLLAVFLIAFSVVSYAQSAQSWEGNVTIGTNTSTAGAVVGAYISTSLKDTRTVGSQGFASNGYAITVGCSENDLVFLKVWGINSTFQTCHIGTSNSTNLSVSLVASGGSCSYTSACSTGVCCSGGSQVNDGTTSGTCASSCTVASSPAPNSGGSSSSSSGGGSALTSESSKTVAVSGSAKTAVSFTKSSKIAVQEVEIATTEGASITNGKVTVSETSVSSSMSSSLTAGNTKVYKYLSITKSNIKDSDLKEARVTFEVDASWFAENNIDPATVKLNRYVSSQWVALSTTLVSSDSGKYVFEATTPGFSVFAISGEAKAAKLTAFELIDVIRDFYAGTSSYTAFQVIDLIRDFYA